MSAHDADGGFPEWLPDRLLSHLVGLPIVTKVLREGLDRARGPEKLQLIRTGLSRKGDVDPVTARRLGELCKSTPRWWSRVLESSMAQYEDWGEAISQEDYESLREEPEAFWVEHEGDYHPEAMVLWGLVLGAEPEGLRAVAAEAVNVLEEEEDQQSVTVQEELRHRIATLDAEKAELGKQLDDRADTIKANERRIEEMTAELDKLRADGASAGKVGAKLSDAQKELSSQRDEIAGLSARLEATQSRLEASQEEAKRASDLERERDELRVRLAAEDKERALREKVEARLQDAISEVRRLERERDEPGFLSGAIVDGETLRRVLAKPIGEGAEHAAKRLAEGGSQPGDRMILEFAGAFGKLVAELPAVEEPAAGAAPPAPGQPSEESGESLEDDPGPEVPEPQPEPAPPPAARRRARRAPPFTLFPFGGAGEVGGSAFVVQTKSGHAVLLDAGQRVKGEYGLDSASPFHYSLSAIDALDGIVISHAHIDHIGSLPVIHSEFQRHRESRLPVLMSEPTRRIGEVMLRDSAKIQRKREYMTSGQWNELVRSDFPHELELKPAYNNADIASVLDGGATEVLETRTPYLIPGTSLSVQLIPVAHVLGSCAVYLTDNDTGSTLLYTGDLGPLGETQRTLPEFDGANGFHPAEVVIMESTYARANVLEAEGKRTRTRRENLEELFKASRRAAEKGGKVLLPAFSLGRTQELLRIIEDETATDEMPSGDVYIGGMGEVITQIYNDYQGSPWVAPGQMSRATEINRWLRDGNSFEEVVDDLLGRENFAYIIVSPAMLSGGWSRAFLREMVGDERHSIVFTGYLPPHGGGIRNLAGLHTGSKFTLDQETVEIKCAWRKAMISAHAPRLDLHEFAKRMLLGGKEVSFGMVHGSAEAEESLAAEVGKMEGASARALTNSIPWSPQLV